jgi:hypothetical protein
MVGHARKAARSCSKEAKILYILLQPWGQFAGAQRVCFRSIAVEDGHLAEDASLAFSPRARQSIFRWGWPLPVNDVITAYLTSWAVTSAAHLHAADWFTFRPVGVGGGRKKRELRAAGDGEGLLNNRPGIVRAARADGVIAACRRRSANRPTGSYNSVTEPVFDLAGGCCPNRSIYLCVGSALSGRWERLPGVSVAAVGGGDDQALRRQEQAER